MLQLILTIPALILGFFFWGFILIFSGGVSPLGKTGSTEVLIFSAPIVGMVIPLALRFMAKGAFALGAWLLALAPLAGLLNLVFGVLVAIQWKSAFGLDDDASEAAMRWFNCIWLLPLLAISVDAYKVHGRQSPHEPW